MKFIKFFFYAIVVFLGVVFAMSNRGMIDLTFYPIPFILSMPLFLFAIAVLIFGMLWGWILARIKVHAEKKAYKRSVKRIDALENELGALRAKSLTSSAVLLK